MRKLGGPQFVLLAAIVLAGGAAFSVMNWDWLNGSDSGSTTIRNVGLVVGGVIAILLASWRGIVAEQSLLNERYQKGAEMLGSAVLSVRLGGIYALRRLAEEHPGQYDVQIMRLFCAFVRHPIRDEGIERLGDENNRDESRPLREDVQAVMEAIGARDRPPGLNLRGARLPGVVLFGPNLTGADLSGANLSNANLMEANLSYATLSGAELSNAALYDANLSYARLWGANLSDAALWGANLSKALFCHPFPDGTHGATLLGASLREADLSGTDLSVRGGNPMIGLTQSQLDKACADENDPPNLEGIVDAETGEPLVWRGKPR